MTPRLQPGRAGTPPSRGALAGIRASCGCLLLLLLGWASAAPAGATGGTINTTVAGPINVYAGETLTIADGGSVVTTVNSWGVSVQGGGTLIIEPGGLVGSGQSAGVVVFSGTLNMYGGTVVGAVALRVWDRANIYGGELYSDAFTHPDGVGLLTSGTTTISGGSVSGVYGVDVVGGTTTITGGSYQAYHGLSTFGGTMTVSGCSLAVTNGLLKGTLLDGEPIFTTVSGPITLVGPTTAPTMTQAGANPLTVECHTLFTDPGATALNACGTSAAVTTTGSVDVTRPGRYMLTYSATDGTNTTTQTRTVNVVDTTPPVVTPPANITQAADPGQCTAHVNLGMASATDDCAGPLTPVPSRSDGLPISDPYPVGTTTVIWGAVDPSGNTGSASQTVTVTPTISAPAPVTVGTDPGQCTASSVALGTPTTADNCGAVTVTNDAPNSFPVGPTTVTWTATDSHGNQATATQMVTVNDTEKPTISAPAPVTVGTGSGQCTASNVSLGTPTYSDNCGAVTVTNNAPGSFPVGPTTVTWTATDSHGNQATATQTVTVADQQAPTITCPANMTIPATSTSGATVNFTVSASDNCSGVSVSSTPSSGSTFPIGTTTVNSTAADSHGNTSTCSFTVTVNAPDPAVAITASPSPVPTGTNLTYTIKVQNLGAVPASGVVLTDQLPAGTSFASATPTIGTVTSPKGTNSTVSWKVGTLGGGLSASLTLVVKVSAKAGAALTNTASVSSSTLDSNPGNNSASVTTSVAPRK